MSLGGQVGCVRRSEAFVKIQKRIGGGGGGEGGFGGQDGCERRCETFVKIHFLRGGSWGGASVRGSWWM